MSLFGNLGTEGLEKTEDRLGGFSVFDSDIYEGTVKMLYAIKSDGGAHGAVVILDLGGREYRETIYFTNKKGENFFTDKNDPKKKVPLPGFTTINDLCQATLEQELSQVNFEDKIVKIYDYDTKKEEPKSVPVAVDMLGKPVAVAILKSTVDKTVKNSAGDYVPTGETKEENSIEKVFHLPSRSTIAEAREGKEPGLFWDAWEAKNKGNVRNKAKGAEGKAGAPGGNAGGPPQAGQSGGTKPKSLFGGN